MVKFKSVQISIEEGSSSKGDLADSAASIFKYLSHKKQTLLKFIESQILIIFSLLIITHTVNTLAVLAFGILYRNLSLSFFDFIFGSIKRCFFISFVYATFSFSLKIAIGISNYKTIVICHLMLLFFPVFLLLDCYRLVDSFLIFISFIHISTMKIQRSISADGGFKYQFLLKIYVYCIQALVFYIMKCSIFVKF